MIIAGPCAIESKSQLENTFQSIYRHIDIFRAGVWKARTSVSAYSGYGNSSLKWLHHLQNKYSVPVAIEVGTPKHVELALLNGIKVFWVGARTTVNSFYVQEISESLRGVDAEIWIKNPIYTDLNLWYGAINRMEQVGLKKIKAIHRGFYDESNILYRNNPRWDLLNTFQKHCPYIPVICDPSHIAGKSDLISEVCGRAIVEGVDSFMIEAHEDPDQALSDSLQQLKPLELIELIKKLSNSS